MVQAPAKPETPTEEDVEPYLLPAPIKLKLPGQWETTDDALIELSQINDPWQLELTADGELVIMSPEGWDSSEYGTDIIGQVWAWSTSQGGGRVLGAQLGARLPDGSVLSPDAAWIGEERWNARNREPAYLSVSPELIVEVVSRSDILRQQREKMTLWVENGAVLGWLIDPLRETVEIYRPGNEPERLERPETLSGEDVCMGLEVTLERIWME